MKSEESEELLGKVLENSFEVEFYIAAEYLKLNIVEKRDLITMNLKDHLP